MAFRFEKASCVVIGTFNMYIIQPQWLAKQGVIEAKKQLAIETYLVRPGVRFHLEEHEASCLVSPERLTIDTRNPDTDCGMIVSKILEALPETPLFGIGNNAVFAADLAEKGQLKPAVRDFPMCECPKDIEGIEQRAFHIGARMPEQAVLNLQLSFLPNKIEMASNTHSQLDRVPDITSVAVKAARHFFSDRQEAMRLARRFFGVRSDHDNTDH